MLEIHIFPLDFDEKKEAPWGPREMEFRRTRRTEASAASRKGPGGDRGGSLEGPRGPLREEVFYQRRPEGAHDPPPGGPVGPN